MNDAFSTYHPIVNFLYFTLVLLFSMFFMHPACLMISLMASFIYSIILKGKKALLFNIAFLLPMLFITALVNPLFNHQGLTILTYLPSGNPLTLESILYGIAASTMLVTVICWFSCYNEVMTSDKFVYLFGRIIPAMSLVISMVLRFVPKFKEQIKEIILGQKCLGHDISQGGLIKRAKLGITILSIMITWALENAIDTADSMKSRGYGLAGRTAFSIYRMDVRDKQALVGIIGLGGYILAGNIYGGLFWRYFPTMHGTTINFFTISLWMAYGVLCLLPVLINLKEARQWKATQLKI